MGIDICGDRTNDLPVTSSYRMNSWTTRPPRPLKRNLGGEYCNPYLVSWGYSLLLPSDFSHYGSHFSRTRCVWCVFVHGTAFWLTPTFFFFLLRIINSYSVMCCVCDLLVMDIYDCRCEANTNLIKCEIHSHILWDHEAVLQKWMNISS